MLHDAVAQDDIAAVTRVMQDYCWALDHRDWDRLAGCLAEDILFEASNMGRYQGRDALIGAFQTRTIRVPVRRHMLASPHVRVSGDDAIFTANLLNVRVRDTAPAGGPFFIAGGYYRNRLVRQDGVWRIAHLAWEATFIEGNSALDPSLPPSGYLSVMGSPVEAPWGGAAGDGGDAHGTPRSASQQVRDLCTGMFRAVDAGQYDAAGQALAPGAGLRVDGSDQTAGPSLYAEVAPGACQHFFFNEKVAVAGNIGRYCAYVYRVAWGGAAPNRHSGGVILFEAARGPDGWRIVSVDYLPFWSRGTPIQADPVRSRTDFRRIATFGWELEGHRERLSPAEEVAALQSRYTWSYDFWNFEAVLDCFEDEVEAAFVTGISRSYAHRTPMVTGIRQDHEDQPYMQHYCANVAVDIGVDGHSAEMRCYATTRRTDPGGGPVAMAGGRYDGYARETEGAWRYAAFRYTRVHGAHDG